MLGSRLKSLRLQHQLTQKQLADHINVTHVSISGYENGNRFPDTDTLQRIADFFNVSTDYLLGRSDHPNSNQLQSEDLNEQELHLIQELKKHPSLFQELTNNPKRKVNELIKLFKLKQMLLEEDEENYPDYSPPKK